METSYSQIFEVFWRSGDEVDAISAVLLLLLLFVALCSALNRNWSKERAHILKDEDEFLLIKWARAIS